MFFPSPKKKATKIRITSSRTFVAFVSMHFLKRSADLTGNIHSTASLPDNPSWVDKRCALMFPKE